MEFQEQEFGPKNDTLKDLKKKILDRGLSFHPYLAMQAINKEVETQLTDLVVGHFKGMGIEMLGICNQEIKEYAEAEEARYQEFQRLEKIMNTAPIISDTMQVSESLPGNPEHEPVKLVDKKKIKK